MSTGPLPSGFRQLPHIPPPPTHTHIPTLGDGAEEEEELEKSKNSGTSVSADLCSSLCLLDMGSGPFGTSKRHGCCLSVPSPTLLWCLGPWSSAGLGLGLVALTFGRGANLAQPVGWRFLWNESSPEAWCPGALGESSGTGHLRQGAASFFPRHTFFHPHCGSSDSVCVCGRGGSQCLGLAQPAWAQVTSWWVPWHPS